MHLSDGVEGCQFRGEFLLRDVRVIKVDGCEQLPGAALLFKIELARRCCSILVDGGFIEDSDLQMSMAVPCFRRLGRVLRQARHQVRRTECINVANH